MSLIKLASEQPIIVINQKPDPMSGSSKQLNMKNFAAAAAGGTAGFAAKEAIDHLPHFDKLKLSHRYGSRMGSVAGALLGAGSVYALSKKKKNEQEPSMYIM